MKVNSINTLYNNNSKLSFKHTAVPYPEYESAYYYQAPGLFEAIADKFSKLFSPKVSKEADYIKKQIDIIYNQQQVEANKQNKQLLSVLA